MTRIAPRSEPRWVRLAPTLFFALVACAVLARWAWYASRAVMFPYPLDYGEGPLLDQVARIAHLEALYRADFATPPYTVANYPPLYPVSLAPFYLMFGPAYWYGRLLSLLSALGAATLVGLITGRLTRRRLAGWVAGSVFLTVPYVAYWSVLFRIDCLALFLSLLGLWTLIAGPETRRTVVLGAVLLVAAVYVRQSYGLSAPLGALAWLMARGRRQDAAWLVGLCLVLGLVVFLALEIGTGGGFVHNIVTANVNAYSAGRLLEQARDLVTLAPFLVVFAVVAFRKDAGADRAGTALLAAYLLGALISGATIGKVGSNVNYFLELSAALAALAGRVVVSVERPLFRSIFFLGLAGQMGLFLPRTGNYFGWSETRIAHRDELDRLMEAIHRVDGRVLADSELGFLPLDGRPIYFQPFEMTQLAEKGLWDPTDLAREVHERRFPLVLLYAPENRGLLKQRWPGPVLAALASSYAPAGRVGATVLLRPR